MNDWYCKPQNEDEAKEILERAVASGAILRESVAPEEELFRWDMLPAWGVRKGKILTGNPAAAHSELANAEELTIHQVRERFPLPGKIDWSKAPEDAQFYSCSGFRKHEDGAEYLWCEELWEDVHCDSLEWHKERQDFELRPNTKTPTQEKKTASLIAELNKKILVLEKERADLADQVQSLVDAFMFGNDDDVLHAAGRLVAQLGIS